MATNESIAEKADTAESRISTVKNSYILRHSSDQYAAICDYLQGLGFVDVACSGPAQTIKSNWSLLGNFLFDTIFVLGNIKRFRNTDILFSVGYITIPIKLFMKLGLIRCRRLIWFGFFLHSPKSFFLFRLLSRLLSNKEERYIVFSKYEKSLYSRKIGIPLSTLVYVPWGSWDEMEERVAPKTAGQGEYYFSGGASNRDYLSLVEAFRGRSDKLVIVCSSVKNKEVLSANLSSNIVVHTDVEDEEFDNLVQGAKACILTLKYNTGASGQSVLLCYMRHAKAIVASNTDVVGEYIENEVSGILIKDALTGVPHAIEKLNHSSQLRMDFGNAARDRFLATFSRQAVSTSLRKAIFEETDRT